MMHGYGDGALSGWDWVLMTTGMIVFWGALISLGVVWCRRARGARTRPPAGGAQPSPEEILAERYARGEMDESEYSTRLTMLRQSTPP
jgi:putative membrane protein